MVWGSINHIVLVTFALYSKRNSQVVNRTICNLLLFRFHLINIPCGYISLNLSLIPRQICISKQGLLFIKRIQIHVEDYMCDTISYIIISMDWKHNPKNHTSILHLNNFCWAILRVGVSLLCIVLNHNQTSWFLFLFYGIWLLFSFRKMGCHSNIVCIN